jgi:hypothetical protein
LFVSVTSPLKPLPQSLVTRKAAEAPDEGVGVGDGEGVGVGVGVGEGDGDGLGVGVGAGVVIDCPLIR